jgi:hypothetical protein
MKFMDTVWVRTGGTLLDGRDQGAARLRPDPFRINETSGRNGATVAPEKSPIDTAAWLLTKEIMRMGRTSFRRLAALIMLAATVFTAHANAASELITCGREKVLILDPSDRDAQGTPKIVWSWQAAGRVDLPKEYHALFRSTDECKPVDGGRQILITSSTGGVALVERAKGSVVFYGRAANAHSADLLPNGRVAVAASRDPKNNQGDALILFDVKQSGRELGRTELPSGHGVVWDEKRRVVWALSDQELRSYQLADWNTAAPKLTRTAAIALPENGGHDLYPISDTPFLSVTTNTRCWLFDRDRRTLIPHPILAARAAIKSITEHPITRQIAFTEAERPNWWTTRIQFLKPDESFTVPGEQFYKVRWNVVSR